LPLYIIQVVPLIILDIYQRCVSTCGDHKVMKDPVVVFCKDITIQRPGRPLSLGRLVSVMDLSDLSNQSISGTPTKR
jgi:hypothetical protein